MGFFSTVCLDEQSQVCIRIWCLNNDLIMNLFHIQLTIVNQREGYVSVLFHLGGLTGIELEFGALCLLSRWGEKKKKKNEHQ